MEIYSGIKMVWLLVLTSAEGDTVYTTENIKGSNWVILRYILKKYKHRNKYSRAILLCYCYSLIFWNGLISHGLILVGVKNPWTGINSFCSIVHFCPDIFKSMIQGKWDRYLLFKMYHIIKESLSKYIIILKFAHCRFCAINLAQCKEPCLTLGRQTAVWSNCCRFTTNILIHGK